MKKVLYFLLYSILGVSLLNAGFTGDMLVKTVLGYKPLKYLQVGDKVICFKDGYWLESKPIEELQSKKVNELLKITTSLGTAVYACKDAKFYIPKGDVWKVAHELKVGSWLLQLENLSAVKIKNIERIKGPVEVFDITVQGLHNFCVTENAILVHNMNIENIIRLARIAWPYVQGAYNLTKLYLQLQNLPENEKNPPLDFGENSGDEGRKYGDNPGEKAGGKTIQDILEGAKKPEDRKRPGSSTIYEKPGGKEAAEEDFDDLGITDIQDRGDGIKTGKLPDGTTVTLYGSRGKKKPGGGAYAGEWTLSCPEKDPVTGEDKKIKIRYPDDYLSHMNTHDLQVPQPPITQDFSELQQKNDHSIQSQTNLQSSAELKSELQNLQAINKKSIDPNEKKDHKPIDIISKNDDTKKDSAKDTLQKDLVDTPVDYGYMPPPGGGPVYDFNKRNKTGVTTADPQMVNAITIGDTGPTTEERVRGSDLLKLANELSRSKQAIHNFEILGGDGLSLQEKKWVLSMAHKTRRNDAEDLDRLLDQIKPGTEVFLSYYQQEILEELESSRKSIAQNIYKECCLDDGLPRYVEKKSWLTSLFSSSQTIDPQILQDPKIIKYVLDRVEFDLGEKIRKLGTTASGKEFTNFLKTHKCSVDGKPMHGCSLDGSDVFTREHIAKIVPSKSNLRLIKDRDHDVYWIFHKNEIDTTRSFGLRKVIGLPDNNNTKQVKELNNAHDITKTVNPKTLNDNNAETNKLEFPQGRDIYNLEKKKNENLKLSFNPFPEHGGKNTLLSCTIPRGGNNSRENKPKNNPLKEKLSQKELDKTVQDIIDKVKQENPEFANEIGKRLPHNLLPHNLKTIGNQVDESFDVRKELNLKIFAKNPNSFDSAGKDGKEYKSAEKSKADQSKVTKATDDSVQQTINLANSALGIAYHYQMIQQLRAEQPIQERYKKTGHYITEPDLQKFNNILLLNKIEIDEQTKLDIECDLAQHLLACPEYLDYLEKFSKNVKPINNETIKNLIDLQSSIKNRHAECFIEEQHRTNLEDINSQSTNPLTEVTNPPIIMINDLKTFIDSVKAKGEYVYIEFSPMYRNAIEKEYKESGKYLSNANAKKLDDLLLSQGIKIDNETRLQLQRELALNLIRFFGSNFLQILDQFKNNCKDENRDVIKNLSDLQKSIKKRYFLEKYKNVDQLTYYQQYVSKPWYNISTSIDSYFNPSDSEDNLEKRKKEWDERVAKEKANREIEEKNQKALNRLNKIVIQPLLCNQEDHLDGATNSKEKIEPIDDKKIEENTQNQASTTTNSQDNCAFARELQKSKPEAKKIGPGGGDPNKCPCGHFCGPSCNCGCSCGCGKISDKSNNNFGNNQQQQKTVDDILKEAKRGKNTYGPSVIYEKIGNIDSANNDFDSLQLTDIKDRGEGIRTGKLPDGRTVTVRPRSAGARDPITGKTNGDGPPTLEIWANKDEERIKIRYLEK